MPVKSDSTGRSSVLDDTGAAFTIKHRMWRPVVDGGSGPTVPENNDDSDTTDPNDKLYVRIDNDDFDCFSRQTYPFKNPGRAYDRLHTVPEDLEINPLPVYDWPTGDLIMPTDYGNLKRALVAVHFSIAYVSVRKREFFSADIKRIDVLGPPVQMQPQSPRKRRRVGGGTAGNPGPASSSAVPAA